MEGVTFVTLDGRSKKFYKLDEISQFYDLPLENYDLESVLQKINNGVYRCSQLKEVFGAKTSDSMCPEHIWLLNDDAVEELLFLTGGHSSLRQSQCNEYSFYYTVDNVTREPWFHATSFAKTMMLSPTKEAVKDNVDEDFIKRFEEISTEDISPTHLQPSTLFINRAGCDQLLLLAKIPSTQEIQNWLHQNLDLFPSSSETGNQDSASTQNENDYKSKLAKAQSEVVKLTEDLQDRQSRSVNEFKSNPQLEHYLYVMVKDKTLKSYNHKTKRHYIPANNNLRDNMMEDELRYYTIRGQKRYCKVQIRKWLKENEGAGELVWIRKVPDPVNGLNWLHKELNRSRYSTIPPETRKDAFTILMNSPKPVDLKKFGNSIDVNMDVYYDVNKQKLICDYFKTKKKNVTNAE